MDQVLGTRCTVTLSLLADKCGLERWWHRAIILLGRVGNKCMGSFSQKWWVSFFSVKAAKLARCNPCSRAAWGTHSAQAIGIISLLRLSWLFFWATFAASVVFVWVFFPFFFWFWFVLFFFCPENRTSDIQSLKCRDLSWWKTWPQGGENNVYFMLWEVSIA